jgi:hypothetical protein
MHSWQLPSRQNRFVPQLVPSVASWHCPAPLHLPVWQLTSVVPHAGLATPAATLLQVPGVARLQAWQVGQVEVAQHTPSVHAFEVHSPATVQGIPFAFAGTHRPRAQNGADDAQSALVAHVVLQLDPKQPKPPHDSCDGVEQAPPPLQDTEVLTTPSLQVACPQETVGSANTQAALTPLQRLPQVPAAHAARPLRGVWPAGSVAQMPAEPERSHAWQEPVHGESQQKPSTQFPDTHWVALVQRLPLPTLPHEPPTQGWPWQSASVVQVVPHAVPSLLHLNGAHATAGATLHMPSPSQVMPMFDICVVALHEPAPHDSPLP